MKYIRLTISEYLGYGCEDCARTLERATAKGYRRGRVLAIPRGMALSIIPDINSAGITTGYHINLIPREQAKVVG